MWLRSCALVLCASLALVMCGTAEADAGAVLPVQLFEASHATPAPVANAAFAPDADALPAPRSAGR